MKKSRIICITLITAVLISAFGSILCAADFGSGVAVLAEGGEVVKSALVGQKYVFSELDFKQGLALCDFEKLTVTRIPESSLGTLILAGRRVSAGTVIKRKNIGAMVFIPSSKDVTEVGFGFSIDEYAEGAEVSFTIRFTDKVNYAPSVADGEVRATSLNTQRDISVFGRMAASDKEGDGLSFMVVSFPENGILRITDRETGEYVYTPNAGFIGKDSFRYVVRDEYGNFSAISEIELTVNERMSEIVFADMLDRPEYNAAVALTAMGVTDGRLIGDGVYFMPDEQVSRQEFVTMAMKCAGIRADSSLKNSFFDDNDQIKPQLMGYVATAQKIGLVNGEFKNGALVFEPNEPISTFEAGVIMARLMELSQSGDAPRISDAAAIPVWARDDIYALCNAGIFNNSGELGALQPITKASAVTYLYRMVSYE